MHYILIARDCGCLKLTAKRDLHEEHHGFSIAEWVFSRVNLSLFFKGQHFNSAKEGDYTAAYKSTRGMLLKQSRIRRSVATIQARKGGAWFFIVHVHYCFHYEVLLRSPFFIFAAPLSLLDAQDGTECLSGTWCILLLLLWRCMCRQLRAAAILTHTDFLHIPMKVMKARTSKVRKVM